MNLGFQLAKFATIGIFLLGSISFSASDQPHCPIEGKWSIFQVIYRGTPKEPTHTLLEFDFEDGNSRLYWKQLDSEGFCERKRKYKYSYPLVEDEVTWTNPANLIECSMDPDMRVGHRSITRAENVDGMLRLYLPLGDEELTYVFKRRPEN